MNPAKKCERVPYVVSLHWCYLHQDRKKTWKEIASMKDYKMYSEATICRHMKGKIDDSVVDNRKYNKGRPEKLTERDKHNIIRQVEILRRDYGYFTTKRLKIFAGVLKDVSDETVRRVLRANGSNTHIHGKRGCLAEEIWELGSSLPKKFVSD